jgi:hypothetical protein
MLIFSFAGFGKILKLKVAFFLFSSVTQIKSQFSAILKILSISGSTETIIVVSYK